MIFIEEIVHARPDIARYTAITFTEFTMTTHDRTSLVVKVLNRLSTGALGLSDMAVETPVR